MQVFVGQFNEKDIYEGKDRIAVEDAKARTGLQYTNTKFVKKGGNIVGLKIWVCDADTFTI